MIRAMEKKDVFTVLDMGKAMFGESQYASRLSFDIDQAKARILSTIENDSWQMGLVAEKNGEIVGMFGGYIVRPWYSLDFMACDYVLYVLPEHRGGIIAFRMLKKFEVWAKSKGAKIIQASVTTGIEESEEILRGLYAVLGYKDVGFKMQKELL